MIRFLFIITVFLLSQQVLAAKKIDLGALAGCEEAMRTLVSGTPIIEVRPEYPEGPHHAILKDQKRKLSPKKFNEFEAWYHSWFFLDRDLTLIGNLINKDTEIAHHTLWNEKGERPLDGYIKAKEYVSKNPFSKWTAKNLLELHRILLSKESVRRSSLEPREKARNAENTPDEDLGVYRDGDAFFDTEGFSVKEHTPLLYGLGWVGAPYIPPQRIPQQNPALELRETGREKGLYVAGLNHWKPLAHLFSPETRDKLREINTGKTYSQLQRSSLVKKMMEEGTATLLKRAQQSLAQPTPTLKKLEAIHDFYYDYLSLHPTYNGNGRVARVAVEAMLDTLKLPPPIWTLMGNDIGLSRDESFRIFKEGLFLSIDAHSDLDSLLQAEMDPRLLPTPFMVGNLSNVAPEDYLTWVRYSHLKKADDEAWTPRKTAEEYLIWLSSWQKPYGTESIRLVPPLFVSTFNRLSPDKKVFDMKKNNYYTNDIIYRGLSSLDPISDKEILEYFVRPTDLTVGVRFEADMKPKDWEEAFDEFNTKLARSPQAIQKMFNDHTGDGNAYWKSPLVSFSTDYGIAREFAFGNNMPADHIKEIKAAIQIGAFNRKVGAIPSGVAFKNGVHTKNQYEEKEVSLVASADPETIVQIFVDDVVMPQDVTEGDTIQDIIKKAVVKRTRVAKRISYNRVTIEEREDSKVSVRTYEITPDGKTKEVR